MSEKRRRIEIVCPCCRSTLTVEPETGLVLRTQEKRSGQSFEGALQEVTQRKQQSEELFSQAFRKEQQRRAGLEKKFKKALESKDELEEPPSPWELD